MGWLRNLKDEGQKTEITCKKESVNGKMFAVKEKEMSLEKKKYDSFGNIISDSNPNFKIPFGFAGRDAATKNIKEAYDSWIGTLINMDLISEMIFGKSFSNMLAY